MSILCPGEVGTLTDNLTVTVCSGLKGLPQSKSSSVIKKNNMDGCRNHRYVHYLSYSPIFPGGEMCCLVPASSIMWSISSDFAKLQLVMLQVFWRRIGGMAGAGGERYRKATYRTKALFIWSGYDIWSNMIDMGQEGKLWNEWKFTAVLIKSISE